MTELAENSLVIGRYTLFAPLASGGMGTVHLATCDDGSGRPHVVAAKRLHPHLRNDQTFATMLLDEARLAVSIRHPNVVEVLDIVSTASDLLLVMEYVPGVSVHELMTHGTGAKGRRAPIPLAVAITIAVDGLLGLHAAHEALGDNGQPLGLIHRDVSPQNLLVDSSGVTKLTDFGVAKAAGRLRSTHDGTIRGKIAYMSPEQVADAELDGRADIYGAAVVLWEMIAGRPMHEAESDVALFGKAMRGPTERIRDVVPEVPPAVDAAIWRALSRDPRRRFPSARAFADALTGAFGEVDRSRVADFLHERAPDLLAGRARAAGALLAPEETTSTDLDVALLARAMDDGDAIPTKPIFASFSDSNIAAEVRIVPSPAPARDRRLPYALVAIGAASLVGVAFAFGVADGKPPRTGRPLPPAVTTVTDLDPPAPVAPAASAVEPGPRPTTSAVRAVTSSRTTLAPATARPRAGSAARKPEKDPKTNCNPPYTEDEQGRHFKSWCLR